MLPFLSIDSSVEIPAVALHNASMETLGARIQWALDRAERNQSDLAKAVGVSRNSVSQWVTGKTEPSSASLKKAAVFLKVDVHWLATGEGKPTRGAVTAESSVGRDIGALDDDDAILEVDVRAGAGGGGVPAGVYVVSDGNGNSYAAEGIRDQWIIPAAIVREMLHAAPKYIRVFEVIGDSMEPRLHEGDRVFIDVRYRVPSPEGIFALWDGLGVVIKRVQVVRGSDPLRLRVISANPQYEPYEATIEEVNIIGRYAGRFTVN
jgi:phage repressor protein C with HTH and peptisase S24 domain